jgi:hypothetical protein
MTEGRGRDEKPLREKLVLEKKRLAVVGASELCDGRGKPDPMC